MNDIKNILVLMAFIIFVLAIGPDKGVIYEKTIKPINPVKRDKLRR